MVAEQPAGSPHPDTPAAAHTPEAPAQPLATIGDRLVAQLADGLIALGLFFFIGMTLAPRFGGATQAGFNLSGWSAVTVVTIVSVVLLAYFVLAEAFAGVTLGKVVAGVRVERPDGRRIGMRASLIRNLMRILDGIGVYLVGAVAILATRRRQRLGDLAAGSVVVRHEGGRFARVTALVVAVLLAAGGIVGGLWLRSGERAVAVRGPAGPPRFARVVITDNKEQAVEKTVFTPDTPAFYAVFVLADVPANTAVKAVWIGENLQGYAPDTKIAEYELSLGGSQKEGNFSLGRPEKGWPTGTYRVELSIAGNPAHTARFRVEGP